MTNFDSDDEDSFPDWQPTQYPQHPSLPPAPAPPKDPLQGLTGSARRLALIAQALEERTQATDVLLADQSHLRPPPARSYSTRPAPVASTSTRPISRPRTAPPQPLAPAPTRADEARARRIAMIQAAMAMQEPAQPVKPAPPSPARYRQQKPDFTVQIKAEPESDHLIWAPPPPPPPAKRGKKRLSEEGSGSPNEDADCVPRGENLEPPPVPERPRKRERRSNPFADHNVSDEPVPSSSSVVPPVAVVDAKATTKDKGKGKSQKPEPGLSIKQQVSLSDEQQHVLSLVKQGKNVFFTGSAGTGKSVLLREIIRTLKEKYNKNTDAVAVTASTGIAACNIGGTTLHSFGAFGLGDKPVVDLIKMIKRNKKSQMRWVKTKVLIIDEISMVDGALFDKLVGIARELRKNPRSMGGLQLVVTGDFFQLPPVSKDADMVFAFEAAHWEDVIDHTFKLTKVFRQKDQTFVTMLNEMRFGKLSEESIHRFKALSRTINWNDGIEPTELYPLRNSVDSANAKRLRDLAGNEHLFLASDGGSLPPGDQREKISSAFMAPKELRLKVGCQVMLIKNTDDIALVNGTMGQVIDFRTVTDHHAKITNSAVPAGDPTDDKEKKMPTKNTMTKYPLVRFAVMELSTRNSSSRGTLRPGYREVLVQPDNWKVEDAHGQVIVSRTQVPLILAWAMSIHKSQGQTLDRVRVDLKKVFEKGQAYVALSRATSLEGLQVLNFEAAKVMAHPRVVEWSETLETMKEED